MYQCSRLSGEENSKSKSAKWFVWGGTVRALDKEFSTTNCKRQAEMYVKSFARETEPVNVNEIGSVSNRHSRVMSGFKYVILVLKKPISNPRRKFDTREC